MRRAAFAAVVLVLAFVAWTGAAEAASSAECGPLVSTTAKAHKRAQRGWDSQKVKKHPDAIARVRLQLRCVPEGEPYKFVRWQIHLARAEYKRAKRKQREERFYDRLTSAPGQSRLAVLRQCESGNRYNDPSAPAGAYGMLQGWSLAQSYYTAKMKRFFGSPSSPPYTATPVQQDILASLLYQRHGTSPWECPF